MFLQNLNSEQQSALIYLAKEIAKADGIIDEIELNMVNILLQQANPDVTAKEISVNQLSVIFDSNRAKYSLMLELLGVALANEDYDSNEKALIKKYANELSISEEKLSDLEKWVEKQFSLAKEAEYLLNQ